MNATGPDIGADEVLSLRRAYSRNGFRPVPIYNRQKRPRGNNWRADALRNPPVWATRQPEDDALSTGIATGEVVGIDIDVLIQEIVDQIVHDVERKVGITPLVRIGLSPKTLLVYRCKKPFPKLKTDDFILSKTAARHMSNSWQTDSSSLQTASIPTPANPTSGPAADPRTSD